MKQVINIKHILLLMLISIMFLQCKDHVGEELKKLEIKTHAIQLREGDTEYIDIMSGNSEYKAISTNNKIVVAEIADNNRVKLKALNTGLTSVIVFDMKAEKDETIKVKVLERIPAIETEKSNITITEGDEQSVKIIAGSGMYDVESEDSEIATATIQKGEKNFNVLITAHTSGETFINITDRETGIRKSLSIRVSIRIPDLIVDHMEATVMVHQKLKINITQGGGQYEVSAENKKLVRAELNGTEITIMGLIEGETSIVVSDKKSLQIIKITVHIIPFTHDEVYIEDGITYGFIADQNVEVMKGTNTYSGDITIPATIEHNGVTYNVIAVGENAFKDSKVTSVSLPETIKEIKAKAFSRCMNLKKCNIPSSVTHLGLLCFDNCTMLKELHLPASLEVIDGTTDGGMKSLKAYKDNPWDNTPENISFIRYNNLTALSIDPENPYFKVENNVLYTKDGTVVLGAALQSNLGVLELPEGLEFISSYTFAYCPKITSVTIPGSTLAVCASAFTECHNLEKIQFGRAVGEYDTELYDKAFRNCYALKEIKSYSTWPLYPYTGCFKWYDYKTDPDGSKEQAIINRIKVIIPRRSLSNYNNSSFKWHIFPNKIEAL